MYADFLQIAAQEHRLKAGCGRSVESVPGPRVWRAPVCAPAWRRWGRESRKRFPSRPFRQIEVLATVAAKLGDELSLRRQPKVTSCLDVGKIENSFVS
jgi:hypothetical protein